VTAHHLGSLDVRDTELYLGDGVGPGHLDQDHVGGVANLGLDGVQLHELEEGEMKVNDKKPLESTTSDSLSHTIALNFSQQPKPLPASNLRKSGLQGRCTRGRARSPGRSRQSPLVSGAGSRCGHWGGRRGHCSASLCV